MSKLSAGLLLAIAAISGCGEIDILAIDRSNVVGARDAGPGRDATLEASPDVAEAAVSNGIYLEAESGRLSGGFTVGDDPTASGGQFLAPPVGMTSNAQPGAARALYDITITTPGTYTVWGRIQSPDTSHNRFWVQVDGESWYNWYITTGEIWYWNRVHNNVDYYTRLTFELSAGSTSYLSPIDRWRRLDRLYFTPGPP